MAIVSMVTRMVWVALVGAVLTGCASVYSPPHLKPLPAELRATLAKKNMSDSAPIFIRIFKEDSQLEVWKVDNDGKFALLKSYPVCKWSGGLGPKLKQGDKQAPEGFYNVVQGNMNPHSKYHLSFNLGYPNAFDRAHSRTGKHLMVHGDCKSAGCYAMTDALMEEIYLLARDAFIGGQDVIPVHAFPFRMNAANMLRHRSNKWYGFWKQLKVGYDHFESYRTLPKVNVCSKRYLVNASFVNANAAVDPKGRCPAYKKYIPGLEPSQPQQLMVKHGPESAPTVAVMQQPAAPVGQPGLPTKLTPQTPVPSYAPTSQAGAASVGLFATVPSPAAAAPAAPVNGRTYHTPLGVAGGVSGQRSVSPAGSEAGYVGGAVAEGEPPSSASVNQHPSALDISSEDRNAIYYDARSGKNLSIVPKSKPTMEQLISDAFQDEFQQ